MAAVGVAHATPLIIPQTQLAPWRDVTFPSNDAFRAAEVEKLRMCLSHEDHVIAGICKMIMRILDVPTASVGLVDKDSCWLRGPTATESDPVPRGVALCSHVVLADGPEVFVIQDLTKDPRTRNSPMVTGELACLRFYAAAPLISPSGNRLGVLCVRDIRPRRFSADDARMLHNFAVCIMRHLEDNADWMADRRATLALEKGMELASSAVMLCDTSQEGWPICFSNQRWAFLTGAGLSPLSVLHKPFWDLYLPVGTTKEAVLEEFAKYREVQATQGSTFDVRVRALEKDGRPGAAKMLITFRPAGCGLLEPEAQAAVLPAFMRVVDDPSSINSLPYFFATSRPDPQDFQLSEKTKRRLLKSKPSFKVAVLQIDPTALGAIEESDGAGVEEEEGGLPTGSEGHKRSASSSSLASSVGHVERTFSGDSAMTNQLLNIQGSWSRSTSESSNASLSRTVSDPAANYLQSLQRISTSSATSSTGRQSNSFEESASLGRQGSSDSLGFGGPDLTGPVSMRGRHLTTVYSGKDQLEKASGTDIDDPQTPQRRSLCATACNKVSETTRKATLQESAKSKASRTLRKRGMAFFCFAPAQ